MAISPINSTNTQSQSASLASMGLDMQSLLQIILTQLTYQDPLKPVDNFEFVSQLAQFTSLEQTRQLTEKMDSLLSVQSATQTLGLLGRTVDIKTDSGQLTGIVKGISFKENEPKLTLETSGGQFVADATLSQVITVR
ncbi:flagellar hook capping protein [Trinickia terrae]|uniref:Basal-body rod modification protein FlgD n=1 Tax=Trinickia terrae TaxID=2571161 RepID=A0A4U1I7Q4_9BURK|nr:flagellar hook capping FlgD N-terminal domain-containing protein [Trinickia terrae]TKC89454.1 flagellar hook capping protein [Trinickia terrae]